jgi:serine/threonine-protein kinase HipA
MAALEEQFRRMAFNIVARNQDHHVKNIAFLMEILLLTTQDR